MTGNRSSKTSTLDRVALSGFAEYTSFYLYIIFEMGETQKPSDTEPRLLEEVGVLNRSNDVGTDLVISEQGLKPCPKNKLYTLYFILYTSYFILNQLQ